MSNKLIDTSTLLYFKTKLTTWVSDGYVAKELGKGLSTNDYTTDEKTKLAGIAAGATKNTVENVLTSTSTTNALSAAQGKILDDKITAINTSMEDLGAGDMLKSVYDTNGNGKVDDADKVNGHTVLSDVPADAVFTDTTYENATATKGGLMTDTMAVKLAGIEEGATANIGTITEVQANGTSVATSGVANIPAATTAVYGVTKLSTSTSSTSTTLAATPSAVKAAYDLASGKDANVIETVKVNNTALTVSSKAVNITVPTKVTDLTDADNYALASDIPTVNNATLTIQKNGSDVNTFSANASTNVTCNITVPTTVAELTDAGDYAKTADLPTVNNATLTIQKNGTSAGTFTANASSAKTINITVPTTVAELTDAGDYALKSDLVNTYKYKGSVANVEALPKNATSGDVYNVESDGMNYAWNGTEWDNLGAIYSFDYATNADIDDMFKTA